MQDLVAGGPEPAGGSERELVPGEQALWSGMRSERTPQTGEAWRQDQAVAPPLPLPCRGSWWVVPSPLSLSFLPHPAHPWAIRRTSKRWEKSLRKTNLGAGWGWGCEPAPDGPDCCGLCADRSPRL